MPIWDLFGQAEPDFEECSKTAFNLFIVPQASEAYRGPSQPDWQIFTGFNTQILQ